MVKETKKSGGNSIAYKVLVEPWITEEATRIAELGKYIFRVAPKSTKKQVKESIEEVYKVKVTAVRTITIPAKKRYRGRTIGWKPGYKKAIISVKKGDKIDIFAEK